MQLLLMISNLIDKVLSWFGKLGAWCGFLLIIAVCIDVVTRYFGAPKPFGWNSTQLQESEYWLHAFLFMFMIGWAYPRQAHVRIDLVSDLLPQKVRLVIEMIGSSIFLFGFAILGGWYTGKYAYKSIITNETSKSVLGLPNVWILKSALFLMFVLLALAAISQFIKSFAAFKNISYRGKFVNPFEESI